MCHTKKGKNREETQASVSLNDYELFRGPEIFRQIRRFEAGELTIVSSLCGPYSYRERFWVKHRKCSSL